MTNEALNLIKQLAEKTPITVTGETIDNASALLKEIKEWVDGELEPEVVEPK